MDSLSKKLKVVGVVRATRHNFRLAGRKSVLRQSLSKNFKQALRNAHKITLAFYWLFSSLFSLPIGLHSSTLCIYWRLGSEETFCVKMPKLFCARSLGNCYDKPIAL